MSTENRPITMKQCAGMSGQSVRRAKAAAMRGLLDASETHAPGAGGYMTTIAAMNRWVDAGAPYTAQHALEKLEAEKNGTTH